MPQKFSNGARGELQSSITNASTSLTLSTGGATFPVASTGAVAVTAATASDWFKAVLDDGTNYEIVYVRTHANGGAVFSDILRGQEGTTARAFNAGTVLGLRQTAADANDAFTHSNSTGNPHNTSKADVGLGNVDNTSDANKPVSTPQANALALKAGLNSNNLFTKKQNVGVNPLTDAATIAVDAGLSNNHKVTLGGNRTLANPTNLVEGDILNFRIQQDATGNRVLSYGSMYKSATGNSATLILSTAPNAIDFMSCYYDGTNLLCSLGKAYA